MPRVLLVLGLLVVGGIAVWWLRDGNHAHLPAATYVPRDTCIRCHAGQHADWQGSHHDLAMDHATEQTVRGDFDDATFSNHGITSRFFRRDGRYFVNTEGADGAMHDYEILFVIGYEPLQQYLIDVGNGRLQCLQVTWDTQARRWYHIQPDRITPDDRLHWTGMQFNANFMCIECHVTGYERRHDSETNGYDSRWHDIDVGCQACHGPGSNHVAWAEGSLRSAPDMGLAVRFKGAEPSTQVDHCARCHARRDLISGHHGHGEPLLDHMATRLLVEPLYHADGQILDEVYVHGSFLQAPKHERGVRCTDCHDPHTARLKHDGNQLCIQCHQPTPPERFPTLRRGEYDTPAHHFHDPGTPGSRCVDCHMPARIYMGVDARRDHSFRVPRPDLTMKIGTPNACNGCHDDKSARWALEEIGKRFPMYLRGRVAGGHYGLVLAAARQGDPRIFGALAALAAEQGEPAIVRATAASELERQEPSRAVRALAPTLVDGDPLVRATAAGAIGRLIPPQAAAGLHQQKLHVLEPLLADPVRAVRAAAARAIAGQAEQFLSGAQVPRFQRAIGEWIATREAQADRPGPALELGALAEARGRSDEALAHYERALALDPRFPPVRFNLSRLFAERGNLARAEAVITPATTQEPENGEAWYSLGLVRAERKNMRGAASALGRAVRLMPARGRVRFNYALALQAIGDADASLIELKRAHERAPGDAGILETLVRGLVLREDFAEADRLLTAARRRMPDHPRLQALADDVDRARQASER